MTQMNLLAAAASSVGGAAISTSGSLARKVAVVHMLKVQSEKAFLDLLDVHRASAILVVLPNDFSEVSADILGIWRSLEQALLAREVVGPVYFAFEDQDLLDLLHDLEGPGGVTEGGPVGKDLYQLSVASPEPTPKASISITNLQGWLAGEAPVAQAAGSSSAKAG
eukprot:CAMPEP_0113943216 /NCGR_PEP_ID=MMETSP1339-20121228/20870_1 /TAXON_ID=94617 /ORGANISM="Fibrocapsa japonica" /LENGTH=165 /DNA_ID=CAMNT_0000948025 /DNA_START=245 /DNA_END=739 /DNA_ORIENTATION=+ /assembly_acc=CAM_ASM_000762